MNFKLYVNSYLNIDDFVGEGLIKYIEYNLEYKSEAMKIYDYLLSTYDINFELIDYYLFLISVDSYSKIKIIFDDILSLLNNKCIAYATLKELKEA